jgi:hypothetical protein
MGTTQTGAQATCRGMARGRCERGMVAGWCHGEVSRLCFFIVHHSFCIQYITYHTTFVILSLTRLSFDYLCRLVLSRYLFIGCVIFCRINLSTYTYYSRRTAINELHHRGLDH